MKWVNQALRVAAEEFVESCKHYVYSLNMHVAAIAYGELPSHQMKIFTDEFISNLKYSNLRIAKISPNPMFELNIEGPIAPVKLQGYDLAMAMDNLKKALATGTYIIYAIYVEPNDDKIAIKLYKVL